MEEYSPDEINSQIHQERMASNSDDFYGHVVDSAKSIMVKNVYDDKHVQNTIGTAGRILKDTSGDQTDWVYSNDRNYGKTGWNGKFIYETPMKPKVRPSTGSQPNDKKYTGNVGNNDSGKNGQLSTRRDDFYGRDVIVDTRSPKNVGNINRSVGKAELERNKRGQLSTSRDDFYGRDVIIDYSDPNNVVQVDRSVTKAELERNKRGQLSTRRDDFYGRDVIIDSSDSQNVPQIERSVTKAELERIKRDQLSTRRDDFYGRDVFIDSTSKNVTHTRDCQGGVTTTTTTTYYDSKGNVIRTVTEVDKKDSPAVESSSKSNNQQISKEDSSTTTKEISSEVVASYDRNYGKSGWNGKFTYETPVKSTNRRTGKLY